jgi:hypothetical protein
MKELRRRRRSAWAVGEVQLGMITFDDLMSFRRDSMDINQQVVAYTNKLIESIGGSAPAAPQTVSLLDCHPELRVLEQKLDQLLSK